MTDQPAPKKNSSTPVWELVIHDMLARDREGRERYGVPLQANNGRDALQDAYEEALDLAVYLRQAIEECKRPAMDPSRPASHPENMRHWVDAYGFFHPCSREKVGTAHDRAQKVVTGSRVRKGDGTGFEGIRYVRPPIVIPVPICAACRVGKHWDCYGGDCSCAHKPLDTGNSSG
jgi:hypothetical protein